jgi:hypothetical protein
MRYLSFLVVIVFLSCNNKNDEHISPSDSAVIKQGPTTEGESKDSTAPAKFDYQSYIPKALMDHITTTLPGWHLPGPNSWDTTWWNSYKKDKSLVDFISGDFNCDNKTDHALILMDKDSAVGAWSFIATETGFNNKQLDLISKEPMIGIGLELMEKGKQQSLEDDKIREVTIKCEGVTIVFFEKAAQSYYWDNGKVKMLQTGD